MSSSITSSLTSNESVSSVQVKLKNGILMPIFGFGTYKIKGSERIFSALDAAFNAGYRLIDTAAVYNNEEDIGQALEKLLPKYKLNREDIFITSKLSPMNHGDYKLVSEALNSSLKKLKTSYLDLYLIHWPGVERNSMHNEENLKKRTASWESLCKIYKEENIVRSIGVSNYTSTHLKQLLKIPNCVVPAVNQVEFHPYWQQSDEFHEICNGSGIVLQAYCSLGGSSDGTGRLLDDSVINGVAKENSISPAQVLLRWSLQKGYAVIPKSVNSERIEENININFSLSGKDMEIISNIETKKKFAWDPENVS